jgi:2-phospho-L-lactate guanylyltransferase
VVSADVASQRSARLAGATVVPESRPGSGLVAAIGDGLSAASRRPWCARPAAVLLADLPALRPEDLDAALAAARDALDAEGTRMAAVPDADGTGTVLLAARTPARLDPAFGPGSFAEHLRRGAVPLPLDLPRLRRDVDTPADLDAALALGVGPRTASALAERTA